MIAVLLASIAAVALYVLAFAPADLGALAFFALGPWCVLARRLRGARLFLVGTLVGAALLTLGCFWIRRSDPLNLVFMVVPESLFFGGFALLLRALLVTRALPAFVALPIAFTSLEFLRCRWPLDGYAWLSLGYTQHRFLSFAQVADLGGVHLLTLLLAVVAGAFFDAFVQEPRRARALALLPGVAVVLLACSYGAIRRASPPTTRPGPALLIVQPNLEQRLKDSRGGVSEAQILRTHFELGANARRDEKTPIDVVVWSETMLPEPLAETPDARREEFERRNVLQPIMAAVDAPLLAGCLTLSMLDRPHDRAVEDSRTYNSAILFERSGRRLAQYSKRVLVPGGEYLPWIDLFPESWARSIRAQVLEMAGFCPNLWSGTHSGIVDLPSAAAGSNGGVRAGLTICFEIAYPHLGRALVSNGAQLLINLSNEAWFFESAEFEQYAAMAVIRAIETRRSLVKVANSGISGWIGPDGSRHLLMKEGRGDGFAAAAVLRPTTCDEVTPYVRGGEWAGAGTGVAAIVLLFFRRRRLAVASATA